MLRTSKLSLLLLLPLLGLLVSCEQSRDGGNVKKDYAQDFAAPTEAMESMEEPALVEGEASEPPFNTEDYNRIVENPFQSPSVAPLSTFSIDVDAASYANVRRFLNDDRLPYADAVRTEELINYFHYDYPQPTEDIPFQVVTEYSQCPWAPTHELVHIGL